MTDTPEVKIKKVKAFPLPSKMTVGTVSVPGQILKLTATGFLIEAQMPGLKTGEKFEIQFEIPVTHEIITEPCVVVKIYTTVETHVIEGHFQALPFEQERKILKFLSSVPKPSPPQ